MIAFTGLLIYLAAVPPCMAQMQNKGTAVGNAPSDDAIRERRLKWFREAAVWNVYSLGALRRAGR